MYLILLQYLILLLLAARALLYFSEHHYYPEHHGDMVPLPDLDHKEAYAVDQDHTEPHAGMDTQTSSKPDGTDISGQRGVDPMYAGPDEMMKALHEKLGIIETRIRENGEGDELHHHHQCVAEGVRYMTEAEVGVDSFMLVGLEAVYGNDSWQVHQIGVIMRDMTANMGVVCVCMCNDGSVVAMGTIRVCRRRLDLQ